MKRDMAAEGEIEGTPAEATWAMMTVIIILVVVIIFCCALPFYRALEKRWHHWDDLGNDPRWDVENFQFSPTSPQMSRDPKYNRLSVCSTDNGSSMGTSTSGINRGDSFRNNSAMPRFPDQVEFKLPPSYDDLFSKGDQICLHNNPDDTAYVTGVGEEQGDSQPLYVPAEDNQEKVLAYSQYREESSKPNKAPQIKKMLCKQQSTHAEPTKPAPEKDQEKKVMKTATPTQKSNKMTTEKNKVQPKPNTTAKVESSSTNNNPSTASFQPPVVAKRNSKVINKPNNDATKPIANTGKPNPVTSNLNEKPSGVSTENNQNTAQSPPVAPVKKTYKKIKKNCPTDGSVKTDQ